MRDKKNILKALIVLLTTITIISCESAEDIKADIEILKSKRTELIDEIQANNTHINEQIKIEAKLREQIDILNIYKQGKKPRFIIKVKLKQSRVSLDIGKHIKDAMNAIEFELPVDEDFYRSISVGTTFVDDFRAGSFVLNGSFSSWNMEVVGKRIVEN